MTHLLAADTDGDDLVVVLSSFEVSSAAADGHLLLAVVDYVAILAWPADRISRY